MPSYTHKNLKGLDNRASDPTSGTEVRIGRGDLDAEHLGVSYFRYGPGHRAPVGHHHREQEEVYVVVGGSGRMRLDDEFVDLAPWDAVRVSPAVVRGIEAGPDGIEYLAVGSDRPEGGDGVIVKDWWTDEDA